MAYIGVSGPSHAGAQECAAARTIGQWAGRHGHTVVCGGLGGVMAAAAHGATEVGGTSVGLLPGTDRSAGSAWLTVALPTGLGEMRNALLVRSADVLVCVGGSWGTVSELALAVRTGVPVVALWSWPMPTGPRVVASVDDALTAVEDELATLGPSTASAGTRAPAPAPDEEASSAPDEEAPRPPT